MKTLVAAFALASLVATSAWAKTESPVRPSVLTTFKADRIVVADSGPVNGAVIVVFEHQTNTFEIEEAPGGTYDAAFQQMLDSFSFPAS